jgi:DNA-binding NtrC family response regulator
LEERRVQRLGSVKEISLDIRILTATNRNLEEMIAEGSFREDLYYRLNVVTIDLPALSDRGGDIMLLAREFLKRFARKAGRKIDGLSPEAAEMLINYAWPGNVRELENVIERAVVLCRGNLIEKRHLSGLNGLGSTVEETEILSLSEVEKQHIRRCLDQCGWNLTASAEKLGIHRNTLRAKIKDYGLKQG